MKRYASQHGIHRITSDHSDHETLAKQFLLYILVGGTAFLFDFTTLFVLTDFFHVHYLASSSVGFMLGLTVNYLLCIGWIFEYRAIRNGLHEFTLFAAIGIVGLLLNNSLLYLLTDGAGLHYLLSKIFVAGIVLIFNFALRRHLLFSDTNYSRWVRSQVSKPSKP
jgi:putative flippase GtrA